MPTLTSNIPGTAPGEEKGRAEQQEPGQAEQAELSKINKEVAGGTLDPAPPYNKMTGRAEQMPHVSQKLPKPLNTDQAEQLEEELPDPNPQVAGGTYDPVNKHWRNVSPKIPKPSTQVAGGTSDPATPNNTKLKHRMQNNS